MDMFNKLADQIITEAKKDVNDLHEFIVTRKKGADKIRKSAEAKGGPSKLTAIHFAAKEKPYNQALRISKEKDNTKFLKSKADALARKIQRWHMMSQREFQTIMGELEAYGEVYIKSIKPDSVKL